MNTKSVQFLYDSICSDDIISLLWMVKCVSGEVFAWLTGGSAYHSQLWSVVQKTVRMKTDETSQHEKLPAVSMTICQQVRLEKHPEHEPEPRSSFTYSEHD